MGAIEENTQKMLSMLYDVMSKYAEQLSDRPDFRAQLRDIIIDGEAAVLVASRAAMRLASVCERANVLARTIDQHWEDKISHDTGESSAQRMV